MKTETLDEYLARGGTIKEPKIDYKKKYYYAWITRGKLKLKKKPRPDHDKNLTTVK